MRVKNISGVKFNRWTVIERRGSNRRGKSLWLCRCDCGTERIISAETLRKGQSMSCGCLAKEINTTHGATDSITYTSWVQMIRRCHGSGEGAVYKSRGIKVCDRWRYSFKAFVSDMGERASIAHSVGRIDNDGDYEPTNCRWETKSEQANNRRTNHLITWNGETLTISQWEKRLGLPAKQLRTRLSQGWTFDRAVYEPKRPYCPHNRSEAEIEL